MQQKQNNRRDAWDLQKHLCGKMSLVKNTVFLLRYCQFYYPILLKASTHLYTILSVYTEVSSFSAILCRDALIP